MRAWGWDTETHLITDEQPHPRPVCHALCSDSETYLDATPDRLIEILRARDSIVWAHNAAYDVLCTCLAYPEHCREIMDAVSDGRILCSMMAECLLQGERDAFGHASLAACVATHFGHHVEKEDTWRLRYAELDGIPIEQWPADAQTYPVQDAMWAAALGLHYRTCLESIGDLPAQTRASVALEWMREWGMPLDHQAVCDLAARTVADVGTYRAECLAHGLLKPDGKIEAKQLEREVEKACAAAGLAPVRTPTGRIKRDKGALEALPQLTPALEAHRRYAHASKVLSTYVQPLCKALPVGRVRPSVRALVATGRTSMSGPPMQQIPRSGGVRECVAASERCRLVIADYDGAELRGLGQAMLDAGLPSPMAELYQRDPHADAHLAFGASMMQRDYAEVARRFGEGDEQVKQARQRAKAGNFGFPGGMGVSTFVKSQAAQGATYSFSEAKRLREQYLEQWKVGAYFDWVQQQIDWYGGVQIQPSGRWRRGRFSQVANYGFQGRIADVAKRACWLVVWECLFGALQGCRLVHFVHDELIAEVPEILADHAVRVVESSMLQAGREYLPDVPMTAKPQVSRRWCK